MKKRTLYSVPRNDLALFSQMTTEAISEEEKQFFARLYSDEAHIPTVCGQMYVSENDNADSICLIRRNRHEYELDNSIINPNIETGGYYDSLSEVLGVFLDEVNIHKEHITLLDWLRSYSYSCVRYDRNLDNMGA